MAFRNLFRQRPDKGTKTTQVDKPSGVQARFLSGNLYRHIAVMATTSSVGLVSIFLVDFVDLYFISLLADPSLTAAVGFAGTLLSFNMAITIGLMIAMSALAARRIGAGDEEGAREVATSVVSLGLVFGVLFSAVFWLAAPALVQGLGGTGDALDAAVRYVRIVVPSMPIMVLAMVCSGLLRAHGDARRAMNVTLAAGIVNAILDPILIFGLGLGLEGAAIASVGARISMVATALLPVLRVYGGFGSFRREQIRSHVPLILAIAAPAVMTNLATPTGTAFVTRAIAPYGDEAVAGLSVILRLMPLAFCVIFALSGAVGPIVGQNFGAHNYGRVRATIRKAILFTAAYTTLAWAILFAGHGFLVDQFKLEGLGATIVFWFAALAAPLFFFNGVIFICNATFNNLDRALWSTGINWARNTLGIIPFVIAGSALYGAPGIVIGQFLGGLPFAGIALWLAFRLVGRFEARDPVRVGRSAAAAAALPGE